MRTTDFTDDKDRVLIRSNGEPTYFASDAAYYVNKRERGFDVCIYLLGADHHGYVNRLKAIAACAGDDPEHNIEILIGQLVKILKDGEEMRLSKRAGTIVTLAELVEEGGVDPLRYTLCRYPADSPLTLDIEEMTRQASENPVYYVQYAHARLAVDPAQRGRARHQAGRVRPRPAQPRARGRSAPGAGRVPARGRHRGRAARAAPDRPLPRGHRGGVPPVLRRCRVLPRGDEEVEPVHKARLTLVAATRTVLANGLGPARRLRTGADVRAHEAGALHADIGHGHRRGCAPADVNDLVTALWSTTATEERRRRARGRRRRRARPGRRARHPGVRAGRGRLPRPGPRVPRRLQGLRRLLRRQGLPVYDGRRAG